METEEEIQRKEEALGCAWMLFLQHTGHIQAHEACTRWLRMGRANAAGV